MGSIRQQIKLILMEWWNPEVTLGSLGHSTTTADTGYTKVFMSTHVGDSVKKNDHQSNLT